MYLVHYLLIFLFAELAFFLDNSKCLCSVDCGCYGLCGLCDGLFEKLWEFERVFFLVLKFAL